VIAQQLAHSSVLFEQRVALALRPLEACLRPDQLAAEHDLVFEISFHRQMMTSPDHRDNSTGAGKPLLMTGLQGTDVGPRRLLFLDLPLAAPPVCGSSRERRGPRDLSEQQDGGVPETK
jgi:hypothetical protein